MCDLETMALVKDRRPSWKLEMSVSDRCSEDKVKEAKLR